MVRFWAVVSLPPASASRTASARSGRFRRNRFGIHTVSFRQQDSAISNANWYESCFSLPVPRPYLGLQESGSIFSPEDDHMLAGQQVERFHPFQRL